MIYAASYFEPRNHHGILVPISRSIPKGVQTEEGHSLRWILAPPKELLADWKSWEIAYRQSGEQFPTEAHIDAYKHQYWEHLKPKLPEIKKYLEDLKPYKSETWLCWEKAGEFCHRNLALALVKKYREDCYGGSDIPNILGRRVRLRNTNKQYVVEQEIDGNMTQGASARLKDSSGKTAFWLMGQLDLID